MKQEINIDLTIRSKMVIGGQLFGITIANNIFDSNLKLSTIKGESSKHFKY